MDESLCRWIIGGMAFGYVALAGAFWKLIIFWKKESQGRLRDAKDLNETLRRHFDETKTK
jgi:hypothetical protein